MSLFFDFPYTFCLILQFTVTLFFFPLSFSFCKNQKTEEIIFLGVLLTEAMGFFYSFCLAYLQGVFLWMWGVTQFTIFLITLEMIFFRKIGKQKHYQGYFVLVFSLTTIPLFLHFLSIDILQNPLNPVIYQLSPISLCKQIKNQVHWTNFIFLTYPIIGYIFFLLFEKNESKYDY